MKKHIFFVVILLSISVALNCAQAAPQDKTFVKVKLPSFEVMVKRLKENTLLAKLGFAARSAEALHNMAEREFDGADVLMHVHTAVEDFIALFKGNSAMATLMRSQRPVILQCILKDSPEAIKDAQAFEQQLITAAKLAAKGGSKDDGKGDSRL